MTMDMEERRREIKRLLETGDFKNKELAERLHVSTSTITSDRKALREQAAKEHKEAKPVPPVEQQNTPPEPPMVEHHADHGEDTTDDAPTGQPAAPADSESNTDTPSRTTEDTIRDIHDTLEKSIAKAEHDINAARQKAKHDLIGENANGKVPPTDEEKMEELADPIASAPVVNPPTKKTASTPTANHDDKCGTPADAGPYFVLGAVAGAVIASLILIFS